MSTNPNVAGMFSAVSKGATGLAQGIQDRDSVALEKQTIERKMSANQHAMDTESDTAKIDAVTAENKKLAGELQRDKTFRSLKAFTADGNIRHLNGVIKDEASASGIVRFAAIDRVADQKLVVSAGLEMSEIYNPDSYGEESGSATNRNYIKAIMQDGTETLMSVYDYKKAVGYFSRLTDEETAQELALNTAKEKGEGKSYSPGAMEKDSKYLASQGHGSEKDVSGQLLRDRTQGNAAGQEEVANAARDALDEEYGGNFAVNFDPEDPKQKAGAYKHIRKIERFGDVDFDAAAKKDLKNIGKLIALGDPTSELREDETGLWDSFTFKVEKYFSDTGGSESASSFAAFRNVIRHTLYGSALTDSEIAAFDEQLGTTNKKLGPLLKETATALKEVQGQIQVLAALEDPYVVAYRMGISMDKLDDIQISLQKTIKYLENKAGGKPAVDPRKTREDRVKSYQDQI